MSNETENPQFIKAGNRAQLEWEQSAVRMMDSGLDPEIVGITMLTAAQNILAKMYPPAMIAFVLRGYAAEWEK
jgi:hypothetical protein